MNRRPLGSSGIEIAPLALGGWLTFGAQVDDRAAQRILAAAVDSGVDFLDLADVYAMGEAERVVGRFLDGRRREDLVISSKVFWPTSADPRDRGLGRDHVRRSIERSLRNLRTDRLDVYFCHREDPRTPLVETVAVMTELVRSGRIRCWGTSCWQPATLRRAHAIAARDGLVAPVVEQPPYSLLKRDIERRVVPAVGRLGMGLVVFSPLAGGVLTGKYLDGTPAGSRGADTRWLERDLTPDRTAQVRRFVQIARDAGLAPATLALAWLLAQPGVTAAILGASSAAQVERNLEAARTPLPPGCGAALDAVFPPCTPPTWRRLLRRP